MVVESGQPIHELEPTRLTLYIVTSFTICHLMQFKSNITSLFMFIVHAVNIDNFFIILHRPNDVEHYIYDISIQL